MAQPRSANGWSANDRKQVSSRVVPGTAVKLSVRNGPAGDLLLYLAARFDREVEDIDNARGALDDWGYAERPIRGSTTTLSNHASGTAIDLNAPRHPLGSRGTFSHDQVAAIRRILADCAGVIRWGGDYVNRADEMHFEIDAGSVAVGRLAERLLLQPPPELAPQPTTRTGEAMLENHRVHGAGDMRLICPTGDASGVVARAWLSAATDGPAPGDVRAWFQTDTGGISDVTWNIRMRDGLSVRPWAELPNGCTQVNIHYDFPDGGTLCLEAKAK